MGRYAPSLAPLLVDFAGVKTDDHVLDVGCGPTADRSLHDRAWRLRR